MQKLFFFWVPHRKMQSQQECDPLEGKKNQPLQGRRGWPFSSVTGDWSKVCKQRRKSWLQKHKSEDLSYKNGEGETKNILLGFPREVGK